MTSPQIEALTKQIERLNDNIEKLVGTPKHNERYRDLPQMEQGFVWPSPCPKQFIRDTP